MTAITEGEFTFTFPDGWNVEKYDAWSFYKNQFKDHCGRDRTAVDFIAIERDGHRREVTTLWLIEVKDYRCYPRSKPSDLGDEMATKVRDSLAGLVAASMNANDDQEKSFARSALASIAIRIVLHLEQPATDSRLFQRVVDPANFEKKLRGLLKSVDPRVRVMNTETHGRWVAWTVAPATRS